MKRAPVHKNMANFLKAARLTVLIKPPLLLLAVLSLPVLAHNNDGSFDANITAPATSTTGNYTVSWTNAVQFGTPAYIMEHAGSGDININTDTLVYGATSADSGSVTLSGRGDGTYKYYAMNYLCIPYPTCFYIPSHSVTVQVNKVPDAPVVSSPATDTNGAFTVSWSTPPGTVTSYKLDQKFNSGGWGQIYSGSATSRALSGLAAGVYNYRVRACNANGCSSYSNTSTTQVFAPPPTPSSISVSPSPSYNGSHTASWSAASGASKYILQQQEDGGSWVQTYNGSGTSKAFSSLAVGSYVYRVKACKVVSGSDLCSGWRTSSAASVSPPAMPTLAAPAGVNDGVINFSWNSVTGATSYTLSRWTYIPTVGDVPVPIYTGSATDFTHTENTDGYYSYQVIACSSAGCSAPSLKNVAVVFAPGAPASINVSPTTSYSGAHTVSWGSSSGATGYELQQKIGSGAWSDVYSGTATSYAASGLSANSYTYRARACKTIGGYSSCSGWRTSSAASVTTPATPTTFSVPANDNDGAYTVYWNVVIGAASYKLQRRPVGGSWATIFTTTTVGKTESGIGNGSYEYRVQACSGVGCSAYTAAQTIDVALTPGIPASITTPPTSYDGSHTVSWGAASGSITKYDLNQRVDGGGWVSGYDGAALSKSFTGLAAGNYEYAVRACKTTGGYTSCGSWRYSGIAVVSAPLVPTTFTVPAGDGDGSYSVSWNAATGAATYELQRQANGGAWSTIQNTSATSKAESGLANGSYGYRVRACSAVGCSGYTTLKTTDVALAPGVPTSISVSPATSYTGSHTVSWGASSGSVSGYELYQQKDGGSFTLQYSGSATSNTPSGLSAGGYVYRVRGCKTTGGYTNCSAYQTAASASVSAPATPAGINGPAAVSNGTVPLSWSAVTGASGYVLERFITLSANPVEWYWLVLYSGSGTSYTDTLGWEGNHFYRLKATNAVGESAYTNPYKSVLFDQVPDVPTGPSAPEEGLVGDPFTVSWSAAGGVVTYYDLQQNTPGSGWSTVYSGGNLSAPVTVNTVPGTYQYRVRACNPDACSGWSTATDVSVIELFNLAPEPSEATAGLAVGGTPYSATVSPDGNATIAVPLQVAPGVNGLQPVLSLSYTSGSGGRANDQGLLHDTLGYGWQLGGFSFIQTCKAGAAAGEVQNPSDRLCLDGEPLVVVSGAQFQTGAVYRTEKENYIRVEQKSNNGHPWFEVKFPDGRVAEYGKTDDSYVETRVILAGVYDLSQWSANKVTDAFGNAVSYTYNRAFDANGSHYPLSITYDNTEVAFSYVRRTDITTGNVPLVLLHTIDVEVGGNKVRQYRLLNENGAKRRLQKVQQCGYTEAGALEACLSPLTFAWTDPATTTDDFKTGVSQVTDGLGATTSFTYALLSAAGSKFSERPFGPEMTPPNSEQIGGQTLKDKHVATMMSRSNGIGGTHTTRYAYHGDGLNSTLNWGFLGFYAQRITDDQSGIVTYIQRLLNDPIHYGSIAAVHQYNAVYGSHTEVLGKTETQYSVQSITHGNGAVTKYPYASRSTSFIYEGGTLLGASETVTGYTFVGGYIDDATVTTRTADTVSTSSFNPGYWGDVATHTLSAIRETRQSATGFNNRTASGQWLIGFPEAVLTRSYDGAIGGGGVSMVEQDAVLTPQSNSLSVASSTRFPGDANLELTTGYSYDGYGNTTAVTVSGANVASRTSSAGSFLNHRYPQTLTNAKSQSTTVNSYDLRFGAAKQVTDPNSRVTSQVRDGFGRVISTTNADGITQTIAYESCSVVSCATVGSAAPVYRVVSDSPVTPQRIDYYDPLGRVVRTELEAFAGTSLIRRDTWYDNQGRVQKQSLPYFAGDTPKYVVPTYDLRNRVVSQSRPDGGSTAVTYAATSGADGVQVTVADTVKKSDGSMAETQSKRSTYDLRGLLTSTTDAFGTAQATIVNYLYHPHGYLKTATVDGGSDGSTTSSFVVDAAGNRTQLIGPNIGTVATTYTALGQVLSNTDNSGQTTTFGYDLLGRVTSRSDADGTATWVWDTAANGIGLLASRSNSGFSESYSYNSASKLTAVQTDISVTGYTESYSTTHTYDGSGRPLVTSYPNGFAVKRDYNSRGYLSGIRDNSSNTLLQSFANTNAFGNVTQESFGNGVQTTRVYDPTSGRLTDIDTTLSGTTVQDIDYAWRSNGTLESRLAHSDAAITTERKESFTYDPLNRVTQAQTLINGSYQRDLSYQYNKLGNLLSKTSTQSGDSDVTGYQYGSGIGNGAGPHAVTQATIDGATYTLEYNANGAISQYDNPGGNSEDKYIAYNAANQPATIVVGKSLSDNKPVAKDEFLYDPDGQRFYKKTSWAVGNQTHEEHTFYVGDHQHIRTPNDATTAEVFKTQVGDAIQQVETLNQNQSITTQMQYLHRDHLGSIDKITDASGNILQTLAFEPFGSRKDSDWQQNIEQAELDDVIANLNIRTAKGFTGHEHLDRTGFIHMNGRVYDPTLGRFLSPDPVVQAPTNSQSWNRYSYVLNNPLSLIDPSGYQFAPVPVSYQETTTGYEVTSLIDAFSYSSISISWGGGGGGFGSIAFESIYKRDNITVYVFSLFTSFGGGYGGGGIDGGGFGGGPTITYSLTIVLVFSTESIVSDAYQVHATRDRSTPVGTQTNQGNNAQKNYEDVEAKIASTLGIDGKYKIVQKKQSEIASKTRTNNAHGTVVSTKDGGHEIWVDQSYKGKDYWTTVYHEMRHVWQKEQGLLNPYTYSADGKLSESQRDILGDMLEYDAWRYTEYVSDTYQVDLNDKWIDERHDYHRDRHMSQSILGPNMPPVGVSCCGVQ